MDDDRALLYYEDAVINVDCEDVDLGLFHDGVDGGVHLGMFEANADQSIVEKGVPGSGGFSDSVKELL